MKLSDYIAKFIKEKVAADVFLLSGGGIMHLVDSVANSELAVYCCHHEQAAVIAAEGWGRMKNSPGVAVVTTGPGGTNAMTGIAGAWLDSIPLLVIAGQVKRPDITPRQNGQPTVRQIGFQELNVIDLVRPITKYAVTVDKEEEIRYHLEKALYLSTAGRPGPVFVEIPLDVQAAEINIDNLSGFVADQQTAADVSDDLIKQVAEQLVAAKKPLLLAGNGIRLAGGEETLRRFLDKTNINAVTPIFTADDLVTNDYPYYLGRQGMVGNKAANYAIDNCDLLLVIGERLQLTQTSYDHEKFATQAKIIMVDIDANELKKKTISIDLAINGDAKLFLEELNKQVGKLNRWEVKVEPINPVAYAGDKNKLNVYKFFEALNNQSKKLNLATADGMASVATHQALKIKAGQRFLTNAGLGNMGSGLPLAIGACVADGQQEFICTEGDGSIMLNLHELQTVKHHQLPLKIFIFNNNGYYSIRGTHKRYFNRVAAADPTSGVSLPDFSQLVPAWGLNYERINNNDELVKLDKVMNFQGPIVCELMIDQAQPMLERWTAGSLRE